MSAFFDTVHISNFKSLKTVTLHDCKRINVLIGKPNVGKSNILEALGLFGLPYFKYNKSKKLTQFIRVENVPELFFDGNIGEKIAIRVNNNSACIVGYLEKEGLVRFEITTKEKDRKECDKYDITVDNRLNLKNNRRFYIAPALVNYYKFPQNLGDLEDTPDIFNLTPPGGANLLSIIELNDALKSELSAIISGYGLELLFDHSSRTLKIIKKNDKGIFLLPLNSIADTLQRLIFFKTAIASNKNSILLFEEPEAHCFPPYITHIAKEIIESKSNQFFIATHSPYILDTFLENASADLAIFIADFLNGQTVIKRLTEVEQKEVYEYDVDLFFNSELFTDEIKH